MEAFSGWSHETVLTADPASVAKARDFVSEHLVGHDLPELVEDVRLVVSELSTNATLHAGTPFVVTLSEMDGAVLLVIQDGSATLPVRAVPHLMEAGGRGLMIVELLSHRWGFSSDGTDSKSVWASFAT